MSTPILPLMRGVVCAALISLPVWAPAVESDAGPAARRIAASLVDELVRRQPDAAAQLRPLAQGLRDGSVTLDEAERILSMARHTGLLAAAQAGPPLGRPLPPGAAPVAERRPQPAQPERRPEPPPQQAGDVMGFLDGSPPPVRRPGQAQESADPVASGEPEPALLDPPTEPAAPPQPLGDRTPQLPSDQSGLAALEARVAMIKDDEAGSPLILYLDRGAQHGLEKGHRLRIEREGQTVVLATVFNVRDDIAAAVVLDTSWAPGVEQVVKVGDLAVRDQ